jgi:TolB-like protein/Tfp pilus assembly protein PilF
MAEGGGDQKAGGGAPTVFVSYASQDAAVANSVVEALETAGLTCWIAPRDVVPGSLYADGIVRAINGAKVFVLMLSKHSVESPHVGKEIERASSKRRPIIALCIGSALLTPAFEYFLSESQWVDLGSGGTDAAAAKLAQAVRYHLDRTTAVEPTGASDQPTARVVSDKSIAVLPFMDLSEKKDQEYFADGMAEEILDLLARVPVIRVISRTSSFQFRGKSEDVRTIGRRLGVAYVVEGSVRTSGDRVRVKAQLIDTRDGSHRWSETFDRVFTDVLRVQDDISTGIVRALQVSVGGDSSRPRPTLKSSDAYDAYLRGRHALGRYDKEGLEQAASHLQQALELDDDSAEINGWLAIACSLQAFLGFAPLAATIEQARRYAERARTLDPRSNNAAGVLGMIHVYEWDWAAAAGELDRAIALAPNTARHINARAALFVRLGRWDDAIREAHRALALDPFSAMSYNTLGMTLQRLDDMAGADAAFRRGLEIAPTFAYLRLRLGITLLHRGRNEEALEQFDLESSIAARCLGRVAAFHAMGRSADSDAELRRLTEAASARIPSFIARAHAFRGDSDAACQWLDRAVTQKELGLTFFKGDPFLRSIEGDPRYIAILRKMHLPE